MLDVNHRISGQAALKTGSGRVCILEEGNVLERGGVAFSHVTGDRMPPSATAHRPELAGHRWEALGVSLVLHPRNPYAPHRPCQRAHVHRDEGR